MATYTLTVEEVPKSEDVQVLSQGLTAHALPYTQVPGFKPLGVFLRDEQGTLLGGVWGYVNWNWLSVGLAWLSEALRGGGYGRQLMTALEQAARERGCQYAHLDTFSWQARPFYEGLGYEVFAILDAYPPGQQRFFMKKTLISILRTVLSEGSRMSPPILRLCFHTQPRREEPHATASECTAWFEPNQATTTKVSDASLRIAADAPRSCDVSESQPL